MTSMAPCHPQLKIDACFHMGRLQSVGKFQVGQHSAAKKSTERRLWVKQFAFFFLLLSSKKKDRLSDSYWKMQITGKQEFIKSKQQSYKHKHKNKKYTKNTKMNILTAIYTQKYAYIHSHAYYMHGHDPSVFIFNK